MVLCYLEDKVDQALLKELRQKLQNVTVNSLTMAQESLAEAIRPKQWYNPFPKSAIPSGRTVPLPAFWKGILC